MAITQDMEVQGKHRSVRLLLQPDGTALFESFNAGSFDPEALDLFIRFRLDAQQCLSEVIEYGGPDGELIRNAPAVTDKIGRLRLVMTDCIRSASRRHAVTNEPC